MLGNLENFFEGPEVQKGIAEVTERALRGEITKKDEDKLQVLKEKYRWPANIANMQIPKIEQFMWQHLKKETRTSDVVQIKVLENYSYSLTTDQSLGLVSSPEHEEIQDGRHSRHLENLFFTSSPEPKGQLTPNLLGSIRVTCRSNIAKIVPIGNPRWPPWPPS